MKKTLSINLGGRSFNVEEEGYVVLDKYLLQLKQHFRKDQTVEELIADIELSMADKFAQKLSTYKQVITLEDVEAVIQVMGHVEEIADEEESGESSREEAAKEDADTEAPKRLYRDADDVVIAGVCSGLAAYFRIDPVFLRVPFAILGLVNGLGVLLYIILWASIPVATTNDQKLAMRGKLANLNEIQELVKEKAKVMTEEGKTAWKNLGDERSAGYRLVNVPIRFVGAVFAGLKRFVLMLLPVVAAVVGFLMLLATTFGIAASTAVAVILMFRLNSPYLISDLPLADLVQYPSYYPGIVGGYLLVVIPLLFLAIFGASVLRRKNQLRGSVAIVLAVVWVASVGVVTAAGSEIGPLIQDRVQIMEQKVNATRSFPVTGFAKINAKGNVRLEVVAGSVYSLTFSGKDDQLKALQVEVKDGELSISERDRLAPGFCLFCVYRPVTGTLVMPSLETVVALDNVSVLVKGFTERLVLDQRNNSRVTVEGVAQGLQASLKDNARLFARDFIVDNVDVMTWDNARAEVHATKQLQVNSIGNSRVWYARELPGMTLNSRGNARIWTDEVMEERVR